MRILGSLGGHFWRKVCEKAATFGHFWRFSQDLGFWAENEGEKVNSDSAYVKIRNTYVFTAEIAESAEERKKDIRESGHSR